MTSDDRPNFAEAFRRLGRTFRLRLKPVELDELTATYFKLLQGWSLDDVLAAAKTCLTTVRSFPKPADWLAALPAKVSVSSDMRWMGAEEASEYLRAETLRYEDGPCACLLCQAANITHKPVRFVPEIVDETGRAERAFCPPKNGVVTAGRWCHGSELVAWYAARDHFYGLLQRSMVVQQIPRVLALLGAERQPGEEG